MKFSLASATLAITCVCLALAWYAEHSRHSLAESKWQDERADFLRERSNLVVAAALLGNRSAKIERADHDEGGWVAPDEDTDTPTDEELNEQYAAESLIIAINIEDDMLKAMRIHSQMGGDEFGDMLNEYWVIAGKPSFEKLERLAANSESNLTIERPRALKNWIRKFY